MERVTNLVAEPGERVTMQALLKSIQTFCQDELDRRTAGFMEADMAIARQAVDDVQSLRQRIIEKDLPPDDFWHAATDVSPETLALYQSVRPGKMLPPKDGEPFLLLTSRDDKALFVAIERQGGVLQCVFRNKGAWHGPFWSSVLIQQAMHCIWNIWPEKRLFTLIPIPEGLKFPGLAYRMAGWGPIGIKRGILKLAACPQWFRKPQAAPEQQ